MSSCRSPISLYGAPSTTFLHVKRVLERVIQRARLPLDICEVRGVEEILAANIQTVPTLKIHSKSYSFSKEGTTNYVLKQAIVDLLQYYQYGEWPCVALPYKKPEEVTSTFLYAHQLVSQSDSCLELQSLPTERSETSLLAERKLQQYMAAGSEEAMGQILSRPIIAQSNFSGNLRDHILEINRLNHYRAIIVAEEDWTVSRGDMNQILPRLRHPLIILPHHADFHRSVNAHWLIHETSAGTASVQSIRQLSHWFDLNIVIYTKQSPKQLIKQCPALSLIKIWAASLKFSQLNDIPPDIPHSDLLLMNAPMDLPYQNADYSDSKAGTQSSCITVFLPQKDLPSTDASEKELLFENRKKDFVPVL